MASKLEKEKGLPKFSTFTLTAMLEAEKTTGVPGLAMLTQTGLLPQPPAGGKILDNACGAGVIAKRLFENLADPTRTDFELICGDNDPSMIDMSSGLLQAKGWTNVRVERVDAQATRFADAEFDYVLMNFGPQLMPDPGQMLKETRRIMRAGATMGTTCWKRAGWLPSVQAAFPDFNPPGLLNTYPWKEPESIKKIFTDIGFVETMVEAHDFETSMTELDGYLELMALLMPRLLNGENLQKYEKHMREELTRGPVKMSWQALIISAKKP